MFEQEIKDIFRRDKIVDYAHSSANRALSFTICSNYGEVDINFDKLVELSTLLKTRQINFGPVSRGENDCGSWGMETITKQEIYVRGIKYDWEEESK